MGTCLHDLLDNHDSCLRLMFGWRFCISKAALYVRKTCCLRYASCDWGVFLTQILKGTINAFLRRMYKYHSCQWMFWYWCYFMVDMDRNVLKCCFPQPTVCILYFLQSKAIHIGSVPVTITFSCQFATSVLDATLLLFYLIHSQLHKIHRLPDKRQSYRIQL